MKIDWPSDIQSIETFPRLDVGSDGTGRLVFERLRSTGPGYGGDPDSYLDVIIADVDGPIRFAARLAVPANWGGCSVIPEDYRGDRLVAKIRGNGTGDVTKSIAESMMVVDPGSVTPRLPYLEAEEEVQANWAAGEMGLTTGRFAVGCGYAGRTHAAPRDELIVRLEDAWSWELLGNDDWRWGQVLGFTCDEVFVSVLSDTTNIARIRLDSLGPAMAPD